MQAPYIRPGVIPLPKAKPPTATYDPQRQVAAVANAYHVREVLRAGGYRWHETSKTWQRTNLSVEELKADYDLFQNLGVILDSSTASLLASTDKRPVEAPAVKAAAKPVQDDCDALFGPKVDDYPMKAAAKPAFDVSSLSRARDRIMRLAASGRIAEAQDLAELRAIVGLLRQALEVA